MIANIYNRDCNPAMKGMEDNCYDLAIVDVNYGIGMMSFNNLSREKKAKAKNYKKIDDSKPPTKEYFESLFKISKNQIIWGANHFIEQFNKNSSCWIVWDKNNGSNDFADCELAWTSFKSAVRIFRFTWNGMIQENMKNKEKRIHIVQKPVQLYKWLLLNYAKKGDKIFDSHAGSMSLVIACIELGFDIDCWEIDKDYFQDAKKRILNHVAQLNMFSDKPIINFYE